MDYSQIINIGILAHVDAGKTTLTEQLLFTSGKIKSPGNVNNGTSITDSMEIEKSRGITVRSSTESIEWENLKINITDSPGHSDFSSEVERVLGIIDIAIVVISAVEGIQSHTINILESLKESKTPFIIFINKTDRAGSSTEEIISAVRTELEVKALRLNNCENEGSGEVRIHSSGITSGSLSFTEEHIEQIAELDETILEQYLDGEEISNDLLEQTSRTLFAKSLLHPIILGSAKLELGIKDLLDAIYYYSFKEQIITKEFSASVFGINHHPQFGRIAQIKVHSGQISNRDTFINNRISDEQKVAQVKQTHLGKLIDCKSINQNDIGWISGIEDIQIGDCLGIKTQSEQQRFMDPVLRFKISACDDKDYFDLANALSILNKEDPKLNFQWYRDDKEMILSLMGVMQKEVLQHEISERFGISVEYSDPEVIYKETPIQEAEGFVRYWMPKPCWAIMTFKVEPLPYGSGVIFESKVGVNDIKQKYQNEVAQTIKQSLSQGIKGWEVTDLKISLISGEDHEIHSRPGDFILATPMGILRALENAGTQLLEPVLSYRITCSEEFLGKITSELISMRAQMNNPEFIDDQVIISGDVPVSTSMDLPIKLNSVCSGKFKFIQKQNGYRKCSDSEGIIRTYRGVNPLDESQWILHRRGAFKVDERK